MVATDSTSRAESRSPKQTQAQGDSTTVKKSDNANAEPGKPLAPPPKPGSGDDYFGSLNLEPNPFEHSFGGGAQNGGTSAAETPGGTKLPSVAALTSPRFAETPSSLLPGTGTTPFNWGGGSLRTGPLSPAMLSAPQTDYFGDTHLRGGFPTPNESSMRTGLTPGGSGSMFPAPSPNSQALFNQLASGVATPNTIDFHRTAMNAAAVKAREQGQNSTTQPQQQQSVTSNPQEMTNGVAVKQENKAPSGPFDPHDNDAANGLFMLAQGRNGAAPANTYAMASQQPVHAHPQPAQQAPNSSPHMTNGNGTAASARSARGTSEAASNGSGDSEQARPARGKGKKNPPAATNGRRKAEEPPVKQPANKKAKINPPSIHEDEPEDDSSDDDKNEDGPRSKMTDEEKRKNFLERNRIAALKCRQRKKQWLANLQNKVEMFSSENDALTAQITQLREEVVNLKTLLLAHKDCPVTQQQGLHGAFMQQAMDTYNPQMNPYGMGGPIPSQPVMAGQGVQRRFS